MNPLGPLLGLPSAVSRLGDGRRAVDFAALLEGAVVPSVLAHDASSLALSGRLRALGAGLAETAVPRDEFRTALRGRLLAVAAVQGIGVHAPEVPAVGAVRTASRAGSRGMAVAAGAMASVVAVTGVAVASQRSLPGEPFYGAKRATEGLQLRFADGPVGKGTQHLELAQTRLREVRALALGRDELSAASSLTPVASVSALGGSVSGRVRDTLAAMDAETQDGAALLEQAFRATGEVEPLRVLATFARRQAGSLERVLPSLPVAARDRAQESLSLVTGVAQSTELAIDLGTCGTSCDPVGAGPVLPTSSPMPVPGASATPVPQPSATDEPSCECDPAPTPQPAPESTPSPTRSPSPAPSSSASSEPSAQPTNEPTSEPTPEPTPSSVLPTEIPLPLPTVLPLPPGLPTAVPLPPVVLPTGLPTLR